MLFWLSMATLFGMGGVSLAAIIYLEPESWKELFLYTPVWQQMLWGTGYGLLIAFLGIALVRQPLFAETEDSFRKMILEINPSTLEIIWISLCAGIGEELLFRGLSQYYIGIWPTAFIFVSLHGYVNPFDKSMLAFSIYLILAVAGFGYLTLGMGIISAMVAHFVYDLVMFLYLKRKPSSSTVITDSP